MSPRHLDAHTLHPSNDGPCVDARPQLEPLVRPVGDNKLVDVGLLIDHYVIIHYNIHKNPGKLKEGNSRLAAAQTEVSDLS